jgi:hypothetical protein
VSRSAHATLYKAYGRELSELLDLLLAGEVVSDRAVAERLVRFVGALLRLHDRHRLDRHCYVLRTPVEPRLAMRAVVCLPMGVPPKL